MADDGLGLAVLEQLRDGWDLPPEVELVDGGTWGMSLLPFIEDARRLLLLDAIEMNASPGTYAIVERDGLPKHLATKISPHQVDLQDALAVAELRGTLPRETLAIGLQPGRVELGNGLSPVIVQRLHHVAESAVGLLETWGHRCTKKQPAHA
jgi:hydrogenase maturation protease